MRYEHSDQTDHTSQRATHPWNETIFNKQITKSDDAQLKWSNLAILPLSEPWILGDRRKSSLTFMAVKVTVLIAADMFKRIEDEQRKIGRLA